MPPKKSATKGKKSTRKKSTTRKKSSTKKSTGEAYAAGASPKRPKTVQRFSGKGEDNVLPMGKLMKLYVLVGTLLGIVSCGGGFYIWTFGIEDVCRNSSYMTDRWVAMNCPNAIIGLLMNVHFTGNRFESARFGTSTCINLKWTQAIC